MLSPDQVATYRRDGVLVLPDLFDSAEVVSLQSAYERDALVPGDHRITEQDGTAVRAVYASHRRQSEYAALIRSSRLLGAARQLLAAEVYLYQFKINAKASFGGDCWAWHQDYVAWKLADNIPRPNLVNFAVFLDDMTEFNGPIIFVPGSHADGALRGDRSLEVRSVQHLDPDDIALPSQAMAGLVQRYGLSSPKGTAGTAVAFHPEVVHGSAVNMSPFPRRLAIATYNATSNLPQPYGEPRPDYLVSRDTAPLRADDSPFVPRLV